MLTDIERATGLTIDRVEELAKLSTVRNNRAIMPYYATPAECGAVSRMLLGSSTEYVGHNGMGLPIYRPTKGDN